MRLVPVLLFAALCASRCLAQTVTLDAGTDRRLYNYNTSNKVYVEAQISTSSLLADKKGEAAPLAFDSLARPTAAARSPALGALVAADSARADGLAKGSSAPMPKQAPAQAIRNVAFVVDRSGGMAGAPIQAVRRALSAGLASLSAQDVVSIIGFGSEVQTLLEATRRDQIGDVDTLLATLEAAGGSALYDALNQGEAQLRRSASSSSTNHLILIAGGNPTKGPREPDDFSRLAKLFASEGTTVSTIGIGQDFDEDLLAGLARNGNGHFHFVAEPEKLSDAIQSEIAPLRTLVGRDAVLTVEFREGFDDVESYGWKQADIEGRTVTFHYPYLFADQDLNLLTSVHQNVTRHPSSLATLRLRWSDPIDGTSHEVKKTLSIIFDLNEQAARTSRDPRMIRVTASTLISEGMQRAIEQLDKGNFRKAVSALQDALSDAKSLNEDVDDPVVTAKIQRLENYLADMQTRGQSRLDRKVLRSGLYESVETPTPEEHKDR